MDGSSMRLNRMHECMVCAMLVLCGTLLPPTQGYTYSDEDTLRTSLLTGYNSDVKPETPMTVKITMTLMSLNYLDIGAQEMCANVVLLTDWTDSRLVWTPASHNNINTLVVRYGTIWRPTLVIENNIDNAGVYGDDEAAPMRVSSDGAIRWISPAYARVSCSMKVTFFPFDQQACFISVYGWAHDTSEMNLTTDATPWYLAQYQDNGEWELEDTSVTEYLASDGTETYKSLYFRVSFKRKWAFPFLSLIVPGVLNSFLMCGVFFVPVEGADKLSYSITVLLSYYVLLTYVSDMLPNTSTNIALLQMYLTFVMIAGTLSTLLSVWTVVIYNFPDDKPIPGWTVCLYKASSFLVCQKDSCRKISNFCRDRGCSCSSCSRRNESESGNGKGRGKRSSQVSSSSSLNQSRPQTTSTFLSKTADGKKGGGGSGSESGIERDLEFHQSFGQRETIVEYHNNKSSQKELPLYVNRHDMSIVSVDGGVENSTKASATAAKGQPVSVDKNQTPRQRSSRVTSPPSYVMFGQKALENVNCDGNEAGKNVMVVEDYDGEGDDEELELTWKMITERMDAVFFRLIGGLICLFTVIVLVVLLAHY